MRRRLLGNRRGEAVNTTANTFIGGVASTIPDAQSLATKLGITLGSISLFEVVGNDIEARIETEYIISGYRFRDDIAITKFIDTEGKLTAINAGGFWGCSNLLRVEAPGILTMPIGESYQFRETYNIQIYLENCTSILGDTFYNCYGSNYIYIPKCNQLGPTTDNDFLFYLNGAGEIVCPISLQTANGGAEEGDIVYARNSRGAIITYV